MKRTHEEEVRTLLAKIDRRLNDLHQERTQAIGAILDSRDCKRRKPLCHYQSIGYEIGILEDLQDTLHSEMRRNAHSIGFTAEPKREHQACRPEEAFVTDFPDYYEDEADGEAGEAEEWEGVTICRS